MSFKTVILPPQSENLKKAAEYLQKGEVVALPTETVYGLAGNAFDASVVKKIFKAKDRPSFDPLIVHLSQHYLQSGVLSALAKDKIISQKVLEWPSATLIEMAMKQFWPGPLTFVLPRGEKIPDEVTSSQPTVAIRMPSHPLFQMILNHVPFPLAAPSANRFGRISPTQALHVFNELNGRIPAIVDGGPCDVGVESTIIKITDSPLQVSVLRPGKIAALDLEKIFGVKCIASAQTSPGPVQAPGMLDQHYAPLKPLLLIPFPFSTSEALSFLNQSLGPFIKSQKSLQKEALSVGVLAAHEFPMHILQLFKENKFGRTQVVHSVTSRLSLKNDLSEMAQNLFHFLRTLDQDPKVDFIIADVPSSHDGLSIAIQDRLRRASTRETS